MTTRTTFTAEEEETPLATTALVLWSWGKVETSRLEFGLHTI